MKKYIFYFIATLLVSISAFSQVTPSGGINGSGTTGYVPKFIASKKIGNSSLLEQSTNFLFNKDVKIDGSIKSLDGKNYLNVSDQSSIFSFENNYGKSGYLELDTNSLILYHYNYLELNAPRVNLANLTGNRVPILNGSSDLVASSTTTTQLSYLDATSSIQTQLDGKLSSTTERLLAINSFAPLNMADATTYYWGESPPAAPTTTQGSYRFAFNGNLTITKVVLTVRTVTNPSSENVSIYIRKDQTTDYALTTTLDLNTVGASTSKTFSFSGLNIPILESSYYEMKFVTPTWVTNPTGTSFMIKIYGY